MTTYVVHCHVCADTFTGTDLPAAQTAAFVHYGDVHIIGQETAA